MKLTMDEIINERRKLESQMPLLPSILTRPFTLKMDENGEFDTTLYYASMSSGATAITTAKLKISDILILRDKLNELFPVEKYASLK